jgi:hypothetical protein
MKLPQSKTDVIVTDPDAAMRKAVLVTRGALSVPKAKIDAVMAKENNGKQKHK